MIIKKNMELGHMSCDTGLHDGSRGTLLQAIIAFFFVGFWILWDEYKSDSPSLFCLKG